MSDDKLIPGRSRGPVPAQPSSPPPPAATVEPAYPAYEPEPQGVDLRRYVFAVLRYKWLLALAVVVGTAGALLAWRMVSITYTAEGNLWIEAENQRNPGDVAPIRPSGLLQSSSWIELLRSYAVLEPVVLEQKLYIQADPEYEEAFASLGLGERYAPGSFEIRIGTDGRSYTLVTREGITVEEGTLGGPVGADLGWEWFPPPESFPPGASIRFDVLSPRDAAIALSDRLDTSMDREGNFLQLSLRGSDPGKLATILNSLMDRHVALAAELKRAKLDEQLEILEEQLRYTEAELADAEQELEEFRVRTISLPSDRTPIAPGLQVTRDPVLDNFFQMRIRVEELRSDRERLEEAIRSFEEAGQVRIEALEVIPATASSSELRRILDELVEARSQLRALQDRYADDYPPVQELLVQINTIETRAIPRVLDGILAELDAQQRDLQARIDAASADLQAIPPRTIEEGRLQRRVQITENLYNELRSRVETARLAAASSIPDVRILDRAQTPQRPTEDWRLPIAAAILFGSLAAAMGGAILLDRMDARFRYAGDVSRDIGLDILGSIPRIEAGRGKKGVLNAAQALEAFRELRIHIGFAYGSAGPITIAISSPAAGEGKSLISSNLAVAFSEVGQRTLLIDGDTRRGDAHKLLGREQSPGLIDYLKERAGQEIIQKTDHANLDFIACGSRGMSTPELLASSRMAYFMGTLKRSYDVIIVDTPPLAAGGDALILSTLTGNLAVVIRTGATEKQLAQAKLDQLSRLPIRVLGAILNDVDPSDGYHYYYASYLPGYEPVPEEGEDQDARLISESHTHAS
ncbi:MAG TPA: polysaccharide biosynthesis tyrosine autokinase [Longimicrobiales bacterium]|nr:polysaccharide biosynthesis tyrosine autokinase [Longimicrobiales bacterium]